MARETVTRETANPRLGEEQRHGGQLGPILCWAVVFYELTPHGKVAEVHTHW